MIELFCCGLGVLFWYYKYLDKFCLETRKNKKRFFVFTNIIIKILLVLTIYDDAGHNILNDIFSYIDINNTYLIIIPFIILLISAWILCKIARKQYIMIFKTCDIDIFLVLALDIVYVLVLFGVSLNGGVLQSLMLKEIL